MQERRTYLHVAITLSTVVAFLEIFFLAGLWLWLYQPVFRYAAIIFTREDFRTNQILLGSVLFLIAVQWRQGRQQQDFQLTPQLTPQWLPIPLGIALGGSLLYLLNERFFDINTLSASLFVLATYGLIGLWMAPPRWRQGLPAALLLVGVLPFGDHMQTFIGYPIRILTAALVRDGLAGVGIATVGIDTILILETGVSQIDIPCSGVKSLWTGMLFLTAATWIERRMLNWRWLLIATLFASLLFVVNLLRVGVLVVVGQVLGWRLAAEMLHVPLGVLGFVAACAAAVALLRLWADAGSVNSSALEKSQTPLVRPRWLAPTLLAATVGLIALYAPRPPSGLAQPAPTWRFPPALVTMPMPLSAEEQAWLRRDGAASAERLHFTWHGRSGSMILVTSSTWRAHHRPERCFEVLGLTLEDSRMELTQAGFPLRAVRLRDGKGSVTWAAAYWFQSGDRTTDDYGVRIWADLTPQRTPWVLVSLLFDDMIGDEAELQSLYATVHAAVHNTVAQGF